MYGIVPQDFSRSVGEFLCHGRGELCSPAGDRRSPLRIHIKIVRDIVSSADLCYNGHNRKPRPLGEVAAKPTERVRL